MKNKFFASDLKNRIGVNYAWGHSTVPGCYTVEATWIDSSCPIGTVWYGFVGQAVIEVYGSYVSSYYRRMGIRTFLHEKMIEGYQDMRAIVTCTGTKESTPWLKKMGFKKNDIEGWRLDIER